MDLSLAIAVGSSLQIALFVAPILVFISLLIGNPLTLEFNNFELVAMMAAIFNRSPGVARWRIKLVGRVHAFNRVHNPGPGFLLPASRYLEESFG